MDNDNEDPAVTGGPGEYDRMMSNRGRLTKAQIKRLLRPVPQGRLESKQGLTYVPQHEIRAELLRIFGPGNVEHTMTDPELIYETELNHGQPQYPTKPKSGNPPYYVACYKVGCNLRVYDYAGRLVYDTTEWHVEENAPLPNRGEAHAMAVTSAQSYALRRAAISLGDAMGLHLYERGSTAAFVKGSLITTNDPDSPLYEGEKKTQTERLQGAMNNPEDES